MSDGTYKLLIEKPKITVEPPYAFTYSGLVDEIRELRAEIIALRETINPTPSTILTGSDVIDQFKRMTKVRS